jgi:acyl-coenzyme A thioesterase 13
VNSNNSVHGTLSACVVDWAAGMAIASTGLDVTGVCTDLSISYLSKAQMGDILNIEGKISKIGKTLSFTVINIGKRMDGGTVNLVHGSHTKFLR